MKNLTYVLIFLIALSCQHLPVESAHQKLSDLWDGIYESEDNPGNVFIKITIHSNIMIGDLFIDNTSYTVNDTVVSFDKLGDTLTLNPETGELVYKEDATQKSYTARKMTSLPAPFFFPPSETPVSPGSRISIYLQQTVDQGGIYYTTDGSDPIHSSTALKDNFSIEVPITKKTIVKAAAKYNGIFSPCVTAKYAVTLKDLTADLVIKSEMYIPENYIPPNYYPLGQLSTGELIFTFNSNLPETMRILKIFNIDGTYN